MGPTLQLPPLFARLGDVSHLEKELSQLLRRHPQVREAYLSDQKSQVVLGLLGAPEDCEQRFELMEAIASTSEVYFGDVGAIIVYDDMSASDWKLFEAISPFYIRASDA